MEVWIQSSEEQGCQKKGRSGSGTNPGPLHPAPGKGTTLRCPRILLPELGGDIMSATPEAQAPDAAVLAGLERFYVLFNPSKRGQVR
jgi:hypothetical protein